MGAPREDYLIFLDTETGGVTPGKDPVIEVAAIVETLDRKEVGRYESKVLLEPGQVVEPEAAAVNGYNAEVWAKEGKPFSHFQTWLKAAVPFGSVAIAVGHNVRFDRDMIDLGYYKPKRLFCPISYRMIDTQVVALMLKLTGQIKVENIKLSTVATALGINHGKFHGAMADCLAARDLFVLMRSIVAAENLDMLSFLDGCSFLGRRPVVNV